MVGRGELFETIYRSDVVRLPLALGESTQLARSQTEYRRNTNYGELIKMALAQFPNLLRTHPRFFGQLSIRQTQTALRFSDHVAKIVFERNHGFISPLNAEIAD